MLVFILFLCFRKGRVDFKGFMSIRGYIWFVFFSDVL